MSALVVAAAAALVAAMVTTASAQAATDGSGSIRAAAATADAIAASLGDRAAGAYLDSATGQMVINVSDAAAAELVRANGAVPRLVAHSGAQLTAVRSQLDRVPGTGIAYGVDPIGNQVVVSYDSTVSGGTLRQLAAVVEASGGAARLEFQPGEFHLDITGGDAIYGGQFRCSLGFNVHSGSTFFFLTAGHCGVAASTWYSNSSHSTVLGSTAGASFPGNDYAIVRYTNTNISHPSSVGSVSITGFGTPSVGQTVTRRGSTTGTHSGTVTQLNSTVRYAEGTVSGLIRTTVCAEPGDSGGPLYRNSTALGLTSGGSGNCSSGGTTFFQPVVEALNVYGVTIP